MKKIAVSGKGGSGKSLITYLLAITLSKKGFKVIVVDSDESNFTLHKLFGFNEPPEALMEFLGGKKKVKKALFQPKESDVGLPQDFKIEDIPERYVKKYENIYLINIGKIQEPMEGCACPMGLINKKVLERIKLGSEELVIVDTEAGIEHFGRGIEKYVDTVIAIAEPYFDSLEIAEKIIHLAQKLGKSTYLLLNKVPRELETKVTEQLRKRNLDFIGIIHYSPNVFAASLEGKVPKKDDIYQEVEEIVDKIFSF